MIPKYVLPPIDETMRGDTNLFGWIVTINLPHVPDIFDGSSSGDATAEVPLEYRDYASTRTHEGIHFIQALTSSYIYRNACLLWEEIKSCIEQVKSLPKGTSVTLPIQLNSKIHSLLTNMRRKSTNLSTPTISGISPLDIIEGAAVYITSRIHQPHLKYEDFGRELENNYGDKIHRVYTDAYLLTEWYLGKSTFDIFSVICYLSLCSYDPGDTFCKYVRALGRSGVIREYERLSSQDIINVGLHYGIKELKTAPQEIEISGEHPVLFPYIKNIIDSFQVGFPFVEFASRPYESNDIEIFRIMSPPLIRQRGGRGIVSCKLPTFLPPHLAEGVDWTDNINLIAQISSISGAVMAMLMTGQYYLQCPHHECPYYELRLCNSHIYVPDRFELCSFPILFERIMGLPLKDIRLT